MIYLDNAATTYPKPSEVYDFMDSFYRSCGGNAGRGQYKQAAESTRIITETRGFFISEKSKIFKPDLSCQ